MYCADICEMGVRIAPTSLSYRAQEREYMQSSLAQGLGKSKEVLVRAIINDS